MSQRRQEASDDVELKEDLEKEIQYYPRRQAREEEGEGEEIEKKTIIIDAKPRTRHSHTPTCDRINNEM